MALFWKYGEVTDNRPRLMPGVPGLDGSDQKQISSLGFGDQAETPGDMQKEDKDNVRED